MNILGLDIETTGLDTKKDRIIEIGAIVYDVDARLPLEIFSRMVKPPIDFLPLPDAIVSLTGLTSETISRYGMPLSSSLDELDNLIKKYECQYVVAHNGANYDIPLITNEIHRCFMPSHSLLKMPLIDTRVDINFKSEPDSRRLKHLALDHGFMNPFEHRAVFDVLTMIRILREYDFNEIAEQSKVPFVIMRALTNYEDRQKAKDMRYQWENLGERVFQKMWVKNVRLNKVGQEISECEKKGFKTVRIE